MKKLLGIVVLGLLLSTNVYANCKKGNCKNGYGIYEYNSQGHKMIYEGEFKNSRFNGDGILKDLTDYYVWEGEFKNGRLTKLKILANYTKAKTKGNIIKIPLSVHILKVSENNFSTDVDEAYVKNDVNLANKVWKQANIVWDLKEINFVNPNLKKFKKNVKWVKNKCSSSLNACLKKPKKGSASAKLISIYNELINIETTRNKNAINVYYIPKMLSNMENILSPSKRCALAIHSYKMWKRDYYKNEGYVLISGKKRLDCNTSWKLAHELGHILRLEHVNKATNLMNNIGSGDHNLDLNEINSARSTFEKYFKILN